MNQTSIRIEDNKAFPQHVGAFQVKLLTAGEEIAAGVRMVDLAGGLPVSSLPISTGNLIFCVAYLERAIVGGPDWLFDDRDGKRVIRNLLEFEDTGVLHRLIREWSQWRELQLNPREDAGGGKQADQPRKVAAG